MDERGGNDGGKPRKSAPSSFEDVESDKVGRVVMVPVAKQIEDERVLLLDHDGLGDIAE